MTKKEQFFIDGQFVAIDKLQRLYQSPVELVFAPESTQAIIASADKLAKASKGDNAVYGVNTGFGKLANTRIAALDASRLQYNLIVSHCCGVGEPLSPAAARLVMILKLLSFARGASGVRLSLVRLLTDMVNRDVIPVIPTQGSVGASGDLAPLAHLAAVMIGQGEAWYDGQKMAGGQALTRAGLAPMTLGVKEGLALINGTQFSTAAGLIALFDAYKLLCVSLITGAMSVDAAMGSTTPFNHEIHRLRGQPGQMAVALSLRELLSGSQIREAHRRGDERVQDPYCLRCQPQVIGACLDLIRQAAKTLVIEANAVTDNPLVMIESDEILSGGNFHGEPVAFSADQIAMAIAEIGAIAQRRIAFLVDPSLNYGLPTFLSPSPGLNSGFMIAEVTAAALMAENKHLAHPCSIDSTPTSANQEDHVSMSAHAACRLWRMNGNLTNILALELLCTAQGIDLRKPLMTSPKLASIIKLLREKVDFLDQDRFLANDIANAGQIVRGCALLAAAGWQTFPPLEELSLCN